MDENRLGAELAWDSLIAETQLATELCKSGMRNLCQVPLPSDMLFGSEDDAKYPLHVGLHALTSGLERLAKLTLLVAGRIETGGFSSVRRYSHQLAKLYENAAEVPQRLDGCVSFECEFPPVVEGTFLADVLDFMTEFATGDGRYSYLDTLSSGSRRSDPYATWQDLCASSTAASARVNKLFWVYEAIPDVVYTSEDDLIESAIQPMFDARPQFLRASTVTALRTYELLVPLKSALSRMSEYAFYEARIPGIPLLGEIVDRAFSNDSEDFLAWEIMQLGDEDVMVEVCMERQATEGEETDRANWKA